jgi:hypothetical protein
MTRPAWHFKLSDGTTTLSFLCSDPSGEEHSLRHWRQTPLDKSAMKLGSGRTKYDDLVPPWYAIAQDDWAGGRGGKNLLDDPTKYADGKGVQTWIPKRLVLGPLAHEDTTLAPTEEYDPAGSLVDAILYGDGVSGDTYAQTFTLSASAVVSAVEVRMTRTNYTGTVTLYLVNTNTGLPVYTSPIASKQLSYTGSTTEAHQWVRFTFDEAHTLTAQMYAIILEPAGSSGGVTWGGIGTGYANGAGYRWNGSAWEGWDPLAIQDDLTFRVLGDVDPSEGNVIWFTYKGAVYAVISGEDTSIVWRRGTLGTATGGTLTTLVDSGAQFTTGEHYDQALKIVEGTAAGQWRRITTVTNATTLTVAEAFTVAPSTDSIYAVTDGWHYVGTVAGIVTDALVVDDTVYLARGPERVIRRYRWTDASGDEFADDGTNKAQRLVLFRDAANDPAIWRGLGHEISAASLQAWGTDLTFGTAERVGSEDSRITSLVIYDDHLYICKEDGLFAIQENIVRQVPVDFAALRSPENGASMATWNLYLIFPLLESLERMYGTTVDDFGPNQDEGLPTGRQGRIAAILPLPGMLVCAIDAGEDGYSSVMVYNSMGWHELHRSATAGDRIRSLHYEVLVENDARLWWNEGASVWYAWMSQRTFDRSRDDDADYTSSGYIETGWLGADMVDVVKLWRRVSVFGTGVTSLHYKLDDDANSWQAATQTEAGATVRRFSLGTATTARRLKLKLTLTVATDQQTGLPTITPVIDALSVDALGRITTAHGYRTNVLIDEIAVSMQGTPGRRDVQSALSTLDGWANSPQPLTLTHLLEEFNGLTVLLEPLTEDVTEYTLDGQGRVSRVLQLTLIEID